MMIAKDFPFFAPTMESFGRKSAKMGFTELSRVPAYIPVLVRVPVELETAVKQWTADYRQARERAQRGERQP